MDQHPASGALKRSYAETGLTGDSHRKNHKKHRGPIQGYGSSQDEKHRNLVAYHRINTPGRALVRIVRSRKKSSENAPKKDTQKGQNESVFDAADILAEQPLNVPETTLNQIASNTTPNTIKPAVDTRPKKHENNGLHGDPSSGLPAPKTVTPSAGLEEGQSVAFPYGHESLIPPTSTDAPITSLSVHSILPTAQKTHAPLPNKPATAISRRHFVPHGFMLPPPMPPSNTQSHKVIPIPISRRGPGSNRILVRPRLPLPSASPSHSHVASSPAVPNGPRVSESPTSSVCMTPISSNFIACSGTPLLNLFEGLSAVELSGPSRLTTPSVTEEARKSPRQEIDNAHRNNGHVGVGECTIASRAAGNFKNINNAVVSRAPDVVVDDRKDGLTKKVNSHINQNTGWYISNTTSASAHSDSTNRASAATDVPSLLTPEQSAQPAQPTYDTTIDDEPWISTEDINTGHANSSSVAIVIPFGETAAIHTEFSERTRQQLQAPELPESAETPDESLLAASPYGAAAHLSLNNGTYDSIQITPNKALPTALNRERKQKDSSLGAHAVSKQELALSRPEKAVVEVQSLQIHHEPPSAPELSWGECIVQIDDAPIPLRPTAPRLSRSHCISRFDDAPVPLRQPAPQLSMTTTARTVSLAPVHPKPPSGASRIPDSPKLQAQVRRRTTTKAIPPPLLSAIFDLIIYRQETSAAPPPGVSPLVSRLSTASINLYRRLLSPGCGPVSSGNPLVTWTWPHRREWYAAKQRQLALNPRKMRKHTYAGARILARRWALEDRLISSPDSLGLSNREVACIELGMRRNRGKRVLADLHRLEKNVPAPPWENADGENWSFVKANKRPWRLDQGVGP